MLIGGSHSPPFAYFENDRLVRWYKEDEDFRPFQKDELARRVFKKEQDQQTKFGKYIRPEYYRIDNWSFAQVGPLLTHKALEFIDQSAENKEPFFLHLCTGAAHYPFRPPSNFDPSAPNDYLNKGPNQVLGKTQHPRTDMVYETDLTTKAILDRLEARGILDETIVIYTSDNGAEHLGRTQWSKPIYYSLRNGAYGGIRSDHKATGRLHYNAQGVASGDQPLRGNKGDTYEGGHRVPLIIRWGDEKNSWKIKPGSQCHDLVGLHDIFRTLAEITGSKVPQRQAIDSHSFANALTGESFASRRFLLAQGRSLPQTGEQHVVRELIKEKEATPSLDPEGRVIGARGGKIEPYANSRQLEKLVFSRAIGRALYFKENGREWKLLFSTARGYQLKDIRPWELYELTSDPSEAENLIDNQQHEALIDMMIGKYRQIVTRRDVSN